MWKKLFHENSGQRTAGVSRLVSKKKKKKEDFKSKMLTRDKGHYILLINQLIKKM